MDFSTSSLKSVTASTPRPVSLLSRQHRHCCCLCPYFPVHFPPFSLHPTKIVPSLFLNLVRIGSILSELTIRPASSSRFANGSILNELSGWQELKLEPGNDSENEFSNSSPSFFKRVDSILGDGIGFVKERALRFTGGKKGGFLSKIAMNAKLVLLVTKRVTVNLNWELNFPADSEVKMSYLTINKIVIERVEKIEEVQRKNFKNDVGGMDLLKGMYLWMRRDLEVLEKENKDMKQLLKEMRRGVSARSFRGVNDNIRNNAYSFSSESFSEAKSYGGVSDGTSRKVYPCSIKSFGEFERRRSKKNGEGNGHTKFKKSVDWASDLESELQKAIKVASS